MVPSAETRQYLPDVLLDCISIFSSVLPITLYFNFMRIDLSTPCLLHYALMLSLRPSMMSTLAFWHEMLCFLCI